MQRLSITTAWNETAAFVRNNVGPLFTIAFALMVLPGVVFQVLEPGAAVASDDATAAMAGLGLIGTAVMLVLSLVGSIAITALALGREVVFGSAIAHGFRRFLPLLGASLLLALAAVIVALPLLLLMGLNPEDLTGQTLTPAAVGKMGLAIFLLFIVFLVVWVRLMLMTPVATAEEAGPIAIIRRSWRLTAGHFWKLLGFALLIGIVFVVLTMAVMAVGGILIALLAGSAEPGTTGGLLLAVLSGLVNALFIVVMTSMIARIYVQLTGSQESAVFD